MLRMKNNQFWIAGLAAMILLTGCGTKTKTTPQEQYDALMKTLNILYEQYDNGEVTEAQADSVMAEILQGSIAIARQYPGDEVGYSILKDMYYYLSTEEKAELFAQLDSNRFEEKELTKAYTAFKAERLTTVGCAYTDIAARMPDGQTLRLSELVGETDYVLVDFWATWCGPCRASLPALKQLYKDLPAGRLEILGVSLDNSEEKWATFIKDQQLVWRHISDLQGWQSGPAAVYGVNSIPATVLIDRNGTIVARNASEEELRSIIVEANLTR